MSESDVELENEHFPMPVNRDGDGPVDYKGDDLWDIVCWCGDIRCARWMKNSHPMLILSAAELAYMRMELVHKEREVELNEKIAKNNADMRAGKRQLWILFIGCVLGIIAMIALSFILDLP